MSADRTAVAETGSGVPGMIPRDTRHLKMPSALLFTLADLSCKPPDTPRHWHPQSQAYAGGDCLLSTLDCGWRVSQVVHGDQCHYGNRRVLVYYFELQRGDEVQIMPVISNPFIERLLAVSLLEVAVIAETGWSLLHIRARVELGQPFIPADARISSIYVSEKVRD
jgi:hypothetical protein